MTVAIDDTMDNYSPGYKLVMSIYVLDRIWLTAEVFLVAQCSLSMKNVSQWVHMPD